MKKLLLLSSNDRRRYAEDIQTVLASPRDALIQFRYRERWVTSAVQRAVLSKEVMGLPVIIGFVANASNADAFIVPIRHAVVTQAEYVADMYVFKLRIGGYADLEQYETTLPELVARSRGYISQIVANENGVFCPATSVFPDLHCPETVDDAPHHWLVAARRLALHPTFENSYFLRVDPLENQRSVKLAFNADGRLEAVDGQSLRITASIFSEEYAPDADYKLTCTADGTNLRVASDEVYDIKLRYDTVDFWLHPTAQNFDTLSRVTLSVARKNDSELAIPAHVRIPLIVRRSKARLVARSLATGLGAALVALPAIFGPGSPIQLRVLSAVLGAGLLAFSAAVLNGAK